MSIKSLSSYHHFKKNIPLLYDLHLSHVFDHSSLTIQYLPNYETNITTDDSKDGGGGGGDLLYAIIGTYNENNSNYLLLCRIYIPLNSKYNTETFKKIGNMEFFNYISNVPYPTDITSPKIEIIQKIQVEAEINRARYMPQNPTIVACRTTMPDISIYSLPNFPFKNVNKSIPTPTIVLHGHTQDGFGINWSPHQSGLLLSGGADKQVLLFDSNGSNEPICRLKSHDDVVEEVVFSPINPNRAYSVSDDGNLAIHDLTSLSCSTHTVHDFEVTCFAAHPNLPLLLTGASDSSLSLWDERSMKHPLKELEGHKEKILSITWQSDSVFASCAEDGKVCVFDVSKDVPLIFTHEGHTAKVSDVAWGPAGKWNWLVGSVGDDKTMQSWKINSSLIG